MLQCVRNRRVCGRARIQWRTYRPETAGMDRLYPISPRQCVDARHGAMLGALSCSSVFDSFSVSYMAIHGGRANTHDKLFDIDSRYVAMQLKQDLGEENGTISGRE